MEGRSSGAAAPGEAASDADGGRASQEQAGAAKLTGLQQANQELREELQTAKHEYNMATGTISSLQRQLEIQESQLRKHKAEKEMLQKHIRERADELKAMATKYYSLREQTQEEMLVTIADENESLQQVVTEKESQLAEQNKLLSDLQGRVSQLQAEILTSRRHIQKQQQAQEAAQSQAETLEHKELQTRVALERLTSRFERFRSKIIQATFSAAGSKAPRAELTDEEVLEAMQKIISDRAECHQMLKQKGLKVPTLHSTDTSTSSPAGARGSKKSPRQHLLPSEKQP
ncbi:coiled-coil domain-containing protein 27 [Podargus strigoides]